MTDDEFTTLIADRIIKAENERDAAIARAEKAEKAEAALRRFVAACDGIDEDEFSDALDAAHAVLESK